MYGGYGVRFGGDDKDSSPYGYGMRYGGEERRESYSRPALPYMSSASSDDDGEEEMSSGYYVVSRPSAGYGYMERTSRPSGY